MRKRTSRVGIVAAAAVLLSFGAVPSRAHPLAQGRMELVIGRDKITLWASVSLEQVVVQQSLPSNDDGVIVTQSGAYRAHGNYLLKHIFLSVDGARLTGSVGGIQEPGNKTLTPGEPGNDYVVYELVYIPSAEPVAVELRQNILLEVEYTPNNPWQSTYITGIRQESSQGQENLLLTSANTLKQHCDWSSIPATVPATTPVQTSRLVNAPPAELSRAIPEAPPDRSHFVAGIAIGLCAVYLLAKMAKKLRR